jgi:tRNA (guanine6-N2)-methyltransferase
MRYEADVLPGLEKLIQPEIPDSQILGPGRLGFETEKPTRFLYSRSLIALYAVLEFNVPRPKALLGQEHLDRLTQSLKDVIARHPRGTFKTLRLAAAGDDSPVMQRLKEELSQRLKLTVDTHKTDDADLLVRLRSAASGWEALISLTPRPLSTRPWRVCDMPGALNATLASVMARLTNPTPDDTVLNLCCGSGTLLIERAFLDKIPRLIGCDTNPSALECARNNVEAASLTDRVMLESWDATNLPLPDSSVDVVLADLPFGQRIGSHKDNEALYPALFQEAARLAKPGARLCIVSHELKLVERSLNPWKLVQAFQVTVGGMNPKVYLAENPC